MRLGFKHFDIGKRMFCITAYRFLDFSHYYRLKEDGTEEQLKQKYVSSFHFNLLPVIRYEHSWSTKSLYLEWFFWRVVLEDETNENMAG